MRKTAIIFLTIVTFACHTNEETLEQQAARRQRQEKWTEPCRDQSALLATTAGSPDTFECPNRLHKMKVQVATAPSHEEAAALVFCECQKEPGK